MSALRSGQEALTAAYSIGRRQEITRRDDLMPDRGPKDKETGVSEKDASRRKIWYILCKYDVENTDEDRFYGNAGYCGDGFKPFI